MLDLSRFSNVLSQFGANFPIRNTLGQPKSSPLAISQTAPKTPEKDTFSFSPINVHVRVRGEYRSHAILVSLFCRSVYVSLLISIYFSSLFFLVK